MTSSSGTSCRKGHEKAKGRQILCSLRNVPENIHTPSTELPRAGQVSETKTFKEIYEA